MSLDGPRLVNFVGLLLVPQITFKVDFHLSMVMNVCFPIHSCQITWVTMSLASFDLIGVF